MQCQEKLGINLFEYYIKISVTNSSGEDIKAKFYTDAIMSLLEEEDANDLPLESIFKLAKDKDFHKTLGILSEIDENVLLEAKFNIDDILCMILGYMKVENFSHDQKKIKLKKDLKIHHPVFNLIFKIIENDEDGFIDSFEEIMSLTEDHILQNYGEKEDTTVELSSFKFTMFISAMINNRKKIIDEIFESENFATFEISFPKNMKVYECSPYAASKLLEKRNKFNNENDIPIQWMSPNIFEKFLDSRIKKTKDEKRVEIDTSFLIHTYSKYKYKIDEDFNQLVFWDDTEPLEYICKVKWLNGFLIHPTIATYIDLKWYKYKRVFFWNFFFYVMATVSYAFYAMSEMGAAIGNFNSYWCFGCQYYYVRFFQSLLIIAMLLMIGVKEGFKFFAINNGKLEKHFSKTTDYVEAALILTISVSIVLNKLGHEELFKYFSCSNILLMVFVLISMFPYSFMFLHMQLLKKAAKTFAKFLFTFLTLLFSYVLIFGFIFDLVDTEKRKGSENRTDKNVMKNFNNIESTGLKVLMMLSGEFGVEPYTLSRYQMLVFSTFVVVSYILFNLILGLTIDDAQRTQEKYLSIKVETQLGKIVTANTFLKQYYTYFVTSQYSMWNIQRIDSDEEKGLAYFFHKQLNTFLKFLISRYIQLHKIEKIFINLDTREIETIVDNKYKPFVSYTLNNMDLELLSFSTSLSIDDEVYTKTMDIVKKQEEFVTEHNITEKLQRKRVMKRIRIMKRRPPKKIRRSVKKLSICISCEQLVKNSQKKASSLTQTVKKRSEINYLKKTLRAALKITQNMY